MIQTYLSPVGGKVAQNVRPQSLFAEAPGAEAAPHLAVFIRQDTVPMPAHQRAPHQVNQLQIGENMLKDPSWQPPGHASASSSDSSVEGPGRATTGSRCCAQARGACSSTGRCRHYTPVVHRRQRASTQVHLQPQSES